jgi:hypothetical protein
MRKLVIAYHGYMFGNRYMEMMVDQFRKLINVKLNADDSYEKALFSYCDRVYIGIVDTPNKKPSHGKEWIKKFWSFSSSKVTDKIDNKVEIVFYPDNLELRRTLWWIGDYARDNPDDYILFFHSKGITHFTQATEDWRKYMEYFVIERWRDCIAKLDEGYDCCGVLWNTDTPIGIHPHFSGAFYWAKASYINTLDHSFIDSEWRYNMEFWIGSNPNAKVFEFHNSRMNDKESLIAGKGHYHVAYPRQNYTNG